MVTYDAYGQSGHKRLNRRIPPRRRPDSACGPHKPDVELPVRRAISSALAGRRSTHGRRGHCKARIRHGGSRCECYGCERHSKAQQHCLYVNRQHCLRRPPKRSAYRYMRITQAATCCNPSRVPRHRDTHDHMGLRRIPASAEQTFADAVSVIRQSVSTTNDSGDLLDVRSAAGFDSFSGRDDQGNPCAGILH
jgi:hypothetical protein